MKTLFKHKEYITIIIAIMVFFLSPIGLRWIDPTAASFDAGVLQASILGIVTFCILQSFVWFIIGMIWPDLQVYFKRSFSTDFNTLTQWQKLKLSCLVYFGLFMFLVLLSKIA